MDMTHTTALASSEGRLELAPRPGPLEALPLRMGSGSVDPELFDRQPPEIDIEELIAFRCTAM